MRYFDCELGQQLDDNDMWYCDNDQCSGFQLYCFRCEWG